MKRMTLLELDRKLEDMGFYPKEFDSYSDMEIIIELESGHVLYTNDDEELEIEFVIARYDEENPIETIIEIVSGI